MMRFGYCCGPADAPVVKDAGFEFIEWSVPALLMPLADDAAFESALASVNAAPLPCEALNCMVPGDIKITGPERDMAKLAAYAQTMCARAKRANIQRIVFGSGAARRVPENFPMAEARAQIIEFLKMLGPPARAAGVVVVVEPLNKKETNIINSVAEGADIVRVVGDANIRLLADAFHMLTDNEPMENLAANIGLVSHTHLATREGRLPPGATPDPGIEKFLRTLRDAGYNGRVSVEATGFSASNARVARDTLLQWTT